MRDRETDSWWSIMTSDAIGGDLEGADLVELPVSEKMTWADWRAAHPDTLVLSIDGAEHIDQDPYANYFASDDTFRDIEVEDRRMKAKEPIYTFHLDGVAYAVAHSGFAGGKIYEVAGRRLLLYRPVGAPIFASTEAYWLAPDLPDSPVASLVVQGQGSAPGFELLAGFDTFWYNWVKVNADTELLE